ncbi:MAG: DUF1802 family protein [Dehalococcoidia bacterium]|nr:DUF1802 family protein [Dehalococcoidia bacterium]
MDDTTRTPALREWAVVWDAVLAGRQVLDIRKGGIHETGKHFAVRAPRFWLYPGTEHQRADLLKPEALPALDRVLREAPPKETIRIEGWAELVATAEVSEAVPLLALDDEFVWSSEYAAQRLNWKPRHPLHLLVLRAHRLAEPIEVPWREEYRGCTSWADLIDLPADPTAASAAPVLDDDAFAARLDIVRRTLGDGALRPLGAALSSRG